jgi:cytochrome c oxidase subunit 4
MSKNDTHISRYRELALVLLGLLFLTLLSVLITELHFGAISVFVALTVASVKVFIVLLYFMHLKFESLLLRLMVGMVFLLFALVIIITFIDYLFR